MKKIDPTSVVSPGQISALVEIATLLAAAGHDVAVSVKYGDLAEPFELRICLETEVVVIWLYPDGADVSGRVESRLEIQDYEGSDVDALFRDLTRLVAEQVGPSSDER